MRNIEIKVLHEGHYCPSGMMMFLAKLTQRGHNIKSMNELLMLYDTTVSIKRPDGTTPGADRVLQLPHSTIKRFSPITVAIVGASRRFLAQARTHQVGMTFVSASLQYSDYSDKAQFVVPYAILETDAKNAMGPIFELSYLNACEAAMNNYKVLADVTDNDTAGYIAPQGLANILIVQGNHESWLHFIRTRSCNRNTNETQFVALRIWEELLNTADGEEQFAYAGPDCLYGKCREGSLSCTNSFMDSSPASILKERWSLLYD